MRRGIRLPQCWMLLVAILSILSGQGSLVGMERFAKTTLGVTSSRPWAAWLSGLPDPDEQARLCTTHYL